MMRRQILTAVIVMVAITILTGFAYPLAVMAVAQVGFHHQANDSLVKQNGTVVGSSLIGQNFLDKDGNPLPQYFQPRPSRPAAAVTTPPTAAPPTSVRPTPTSSATSPASASPTPTPYATPADPYCVPVQATDKDDNPVVDSHGNPVYQKNNDGTYVCNSNTVPERAIAYRQLNGLQADAKVPVDAVTASGSGFDPDISIANADLQAPRVAKARNLPLATVMALISSHTASRSSGSSGRRGSTCSTSTWRSTPPLTESQWPMMTVLVADPDQHSRRLMTAALRHAGYVVETARSASQIDSLLRRRHIGAVILDPAETDPVATSSRHCEPKPTLPSSSSVTPVASGTRLPCSTPAPTTTSPSQSAPRNCWPGSACVFRRLPRPDTEAAPISTPDFTIHLTDRRWIRHNGTEVRLTPIEWRLVEMLVGHPGHLVPHAELLQGVWGPSADQQDQLPPGANGSNPPQGRAGAGTPPLLHHRPRPRIAVRPGRW